MEHTLTFIVHFTLPLLAVELFRRTRLRRRGQDEGGESCQGIPDEEAGYGQDTLSRDSFEPSYGAVGDWSVAYMYVRVD